MWGNVQGWAISVVIAVGFFIGIFVIQKDGTGASPPSPKFAAFVEHMEPLRLPTAPETIVPTDEDTDAAPAYREAIDAFNANAYLYRSPFNSKAMDKYTASDLLAKATHAKTMELWSKSPEEIVNFDHEKAPLFALLTVGQLTATRATVELRAGDTADAKKDAEAVFSLGAKLFKERLVYDELEAGLGLMGSADHILIEVAKVEKDATREQQVSKFDEARLALAAKDGPINSLMQITDTVEGKVSGARAGDIFLLAQKSPERLWRVQACLQMARLHRNVGDTGRAADQRAAQLILRKLADTDPDPIVKLAAAKARDMTDAEYNKQ